MAKVMFSVVSVHQSVGTVHDRGPTSLYRRSLAMFKLVHMDCEKKGGWHSTEMPSCWKCIWKPGFQFSWHVEVSTSFKIWNYPLVSSTEKKRKIGMGTIWKCFNPGTLLIIVGIGCDNLEKIIHHMQFCSVTFIYKKTIYIPVGCIPSALDHFSLLY